MRDYLSIPNLLRAMPLAAVVTVLALPRIVEGGALLRIGLAQAFVACFLAMTLVSGAVTAWGRKGGMPGILTDRQTLLQGLALALLLSLAALPLFRYGLDPLYRGVLDVPGRGSAFEMHFPSTLRGQLATLGWMVGFQTLFVCAAPMSLFARLTGRRNVAVALCAALTAFLVHLKAAEQGVQEHYLLFALPGIAGSVLAAVVFSRYGLVPTMFLAGGMTLHLFLPPWLR
jgi:hypothetical protein